MVDVQSVLEGDRLVLSRLLSQIENDTREGQQALADLFSYTGQAQLIGVTGAPGTGKSGGVSRPKSVSRGPKFSLIKRSRLYYSRLSHIYRGGGRPKRVIPRI